jgi:hypothetical protein
MLPNVEDTVALEATAVDSPSQTPYWLLVLAFPEFWLPMIEMSPVVLRILALGAR